MIFMLRIIGYSFVLRFDCFLDFLLQVEDLIRVSSSSRFRSVVLVNSRTVVLDSVIEIFLDHLLACIDAFLQ